MRTLFHPTREDLALSQILYALSDPGRLRIVSQLAEAKEEMSCGDCSAGDGVAKSTLSHHFKVLRESGLTRTRPQGTRLMVALRADDLEARFPGLLESILHAYRTAAENEAMVSGH